MSKIDHALYGYAEIIHVKGVLSRRARSPRSHLLPPPVAAGSPATPIASIGSCLSIVVESPRRFCTSSYPKAHSFPMLLGTGVLRPESSGVDVPDDAPALGLVTSRQSPSLPSRPSKRALKYRRKLALDGTKCPGKVRRAQSLS